jgi:pimeloyl-ACP methyl ester carboxylesterase
MATFVLVHGSWHGGWCWRKLTPFLHARGHMVFTPTLTGLGERSHLLKRDVGLVTHVQDITSLLAFEDLWDVVLVGHHYGGMVISGVAEQASHRIARLIYFDAFVPEDAQSCFDINPGSRIWFHEQARTLGDGWWVPPPPPEFMGITDPIDAEWLKARMTPMPLLAHEQKLQLRSIDAMRLPRSYVWCTWFEGFGETAAHVRRLGWDYHELRTGHDAMLIVPGQVARALEQCSGHD